MGQLKKIEILGYRSIKDMSLELGPLNVLIGANGSGKSNLVSFFKMLNEMIGGRLREYVGTTGRARSILHFGPKQTPQLVSRLIVEDDQGTYRYYLRLVHAAGDTLVFADEVLSFVGVGGDAQAFPQALGVGHQETSLRDADWTSESRAGVFRGFLEKCRGYHFHDTSPTASIRQACSINENRWLRFDAGNLAAMLYLYQERSPLIYKRIVSTIRKIMPQFKDFDLAPNRLNPREIMLNWRKEGHEYLFEPHQISDGTLRAMAIVTLLLQPQDDLPEVIILDEPELGLHPDAVEIVAGLIRAASTKCQVIAATQSITFLNHFEPAEIVVVEDSPEGGSRYSRLSEEGLDVWLKDYSIGELWQRNVLAGAGPMP